MVQEEIGPKVVTRTFKNILSVHNKLLSIAILPRKKKARQNKRNEKEYKHGSYFQTKPQDFSFFVPPVQDFDAPSCHSSVRLHKIDCCAVYTMCLIRNPLKVLSQRLTCHSSTENSNMPISWDLLPSFLSSFENVFV